MNPMSSEELRHRPAAVRKKAGREPQRREDAKAACRVDFKLLCRRWKWRQGESVRWTPCQARKRDSVQRRSTGGRPLQAFQGHRLMGIQAHGRGSTEPRRQSDSQCPTSRLPAQDRERFPDMGTRTGGSRNLIRREHAHGRPINRRPDRPQHRRSQTGSSWRDALSIPDTPPRHDRQPA
jgi:hypothetical protein